MLKRFGSPGHRFALLSSPGEGSRGPWNGTTGPLKLVESAEMVPVFAVRVHSAASLRRAALDCVPNRVHEVALPLGVPTNQFGLWVASMKANGDATPPAVLFEIRAAVLDANEVAASLTYDQAAWGDERMVAEVTGARALEWQVWARIDALESPAAPVQVVFAFLLERVDSTERGLILGDFTTET